MNIICIKISTMMKETLSKYIMTAGFESVLQFYSTFVNVKFSISNQQINTMFKTYDDIFMFNFAYY